MKNTIKNTIKNTMKNTYSKVDVYFYLYLFLITFFSVVSQYLFKQIEKNRATNDVDANKFTNINNLYLGIGLLMYTLLGFSIYKLLPYGSLIVLNIIWHLVYFIVLFIMGYIIYKEKYTFEKIIALIFGFISLVIFMVYGIE
jgi:drug/metabolite transporter (DMT)-like permease